MNTAQDSQFIVEQLMRVTEKEARYLERTAARLRPFIGPGGRVSEGLNRQRAFSLRTIKRLHDWLAHTLRKPALRGHLTQRSTTFGPNFGKE